MPVCSGDQVTDDFANRPALAGGSPLQRCPGSVVDLDVSGTVRGAPLAGEETSCCPASLEVDPSAVGGLRPLEAASDHAGVVLGIEQLAGRGFEREGLGGRRSERCCLPAEDGGVVRWDPFEPEKLGGFTE